MQIIITHDTSPISGSGYLAKFLPGGDMAFGTTIQEAARVVADRNLKGSEGAAVIFMGQIQYMIQRKQPEGTK